MRIFVNGWFSDQLTAGSGQYLNALAEWLPRVGGAHEFVLVEAAMRQRINESANQRIAESTNQRGDESAIRHSPFAIPAYWQVIPARTPFDHLNANLAKLWFEQVTFPRICRRLRADVAFVPYWGSPWWRPCPVVVTVHDLIPLLLRPYRGGMLPRTYTWLVGRTARRAAAVLTDSEASKRDIVAHLGIPAERLHAIHLAADRRFGPVTDPNDLERVRAKYDLPKEPFLLYLGGFDVRKNVARTVQAFARMLGQWTTDGGRLGDRGDRPSSIVHRPPQLVIAGQLPEIDTAFAPDPRRLADSLGIRDRVRFTGWVDEADKPALYSMALGTVFVSEYEGFGLPVLEALACDAVHFS